MVWSSCARALADPGLGIVQRAREFVPYRRHALLDTGRSISELPRMPRDDGLHRPARFRSAAGGRRGMDVGQRRDRLPILVRLLQSERAFMAMHLTGAMKGNGITEREWNPVGGALR